MNQWNCPHCHGPIGPVPSLAGNSVACPYCLSPITVPAGASVRRRSGWKWGLAVVMLLAVAATVCLITNPHALPDRLLGYGSPRFALDFAMADRNIAATPTPRQVVLPDPIAVLDESVMAVVNYEAMTNRFEQEIERELQLEQQLELRRDIQQELPLETGQDLRQETWPSPHEPQLPQDHERQDDALQDVVQEFQHHELDAAAEPDELNVVDDNVAAISEPGLGVSRDTVIHAIQDFFDVEFDEQESTSGELHEVTAHIAGAELTLGSDSSQLRSVTISGSFDGEYMAVLLATVISHVMPSWRIEDAGDWFSKAIEKCDGETLVSTFRDDVALTMATTEAEPDRYSVFFHPEG